MPVPLDQAGATELTRTTASGSLIDDLAHRQRLAHDVLPDDSRDNPTNADGLAAVMTEGEFIEIGLQVLGANRSGVRAERPALQKQCRPVATLQDVALAPLLVCLHHCRLAPLVQAALVGLSLQIYVWLNATLRGGLRATCPSRNRSTINQVV
jgi:hypothetical protein